MYTLTVQQKCQDLTIQSKWSHLASGSFLAPAPLGQTQNFRFLLGPSFFTVRRRHFSLWPLHSGATGGPLNIDFHWSLEFEQDKFWEDDTSSWEHNELSVDVGVSFSARETLKNDFKLSCWGLADLKNDFKTPYYAITLNRNFVNAFQDFGINNGIS